MNRTILRHGGRCVLAAAFLALASCAAPERDETPTHTGASAEPDTYEHVFELAEKTMNQMGRVETSDPARGYISGITPSGVKLEVEVIRVQGRAPEVQVQAQVPEGMTGLGDITEPERYLDIYRSLGGR